MTIIKVVTGLQPLLKFVVRIARCAQVSSHQYFSRATMWHTATLPVIYAVRLLRNVSISALDRPCAVSLPVSPAVIMSFILMLGLSKSELLWRTVEWRRASINPRFTRECALIMDWLCFSQVEMEWSLFLTEIHCSPSLARLVWFITQTACSRARHYLSNAALLKKVPQDFVSYYQRRVAVHFDCHRHMAETRRSEIIGRVKKENMRAF